MAVLISFLAGNMDVVLFVSVHIAEHIVGDVGSRSLHQFVRSFRAVGHQEETRTEIVFSTAQVQQIFGVGSILQHATHVDAWVGLVHQNKFVGVDAVSGCRPVEGPEVGRYVSLFGGERCGGDHIHAAFVFCDVATCHAHVIEAVAIEL